jgi:hypothetical protein
VSRGGCFNAGQDWTFVTIDNCSIRISTKGPSTAGGGISGPGQRHFVTANTGMPTVSASRVPMQSTAGERVRPALDAEQSGLGLSRRRYVRALYAGDLKVENCSIRALVNSRHDVDASGNWGASACCRSTDRCNGGALVDTAPGWRRDDTTTARAASRVISHPCDRRRQPAGGYGRRHPEGVNLATLAVR